MHDRFERFFAPKFLLFFNVAIIIAAETVGGGRWFYDTGFIHVPVIIFLFLACTRIFGRYRLFDRASRRFLGWNLMALVLLLLSHAVEFADQNFDNGWDAATVYGAVISLHLAAFLAVTIGAYPILKAFGKSRSALAWTVLSVAVAVTALYESLAAFLGYVPGVSPILFMAFTFVAGLSTIIPLMIVSQHVPKLEDFCLHLTGALIFSIVATTVDAFHLTAGGQYALYQQATYISHFAFYAALSLMFLALGKLANSGGAFELSDVIAASQKREAGIKRKSDAMAGKGV
ncbi:MAG TPA: hypothetical protein VL426_00860 [Candidatus Binatia bacterium]|jgi:hypothetical protein|nr:hypothetical protein [Candidatus Binatia bacterium]